MNWNRSETLALAKDRCVTCQGVGLLEGRKEEEPCHCVLRAIFRACFRRFVECASKNEGSGRISLERAVRREPIGCWSRKEEEFTADFCLVAKRTLNEEEHRIFRFHFLLGADYKLCCLKLKMDRGTFFHTVYRIQRKLGKAFREIEPYPLFPLSDYFGGPTRTHAAKVVVMEPERKPVQVARRIWKETPKAA